MMKERIAIILALAIYSIGSIAQPVTYNCPMHPHIYATKPGYCSICGMKLVKEKATAVFSRMHGHDFSLLNDGEEYAAMKKDTIGFSTSQKGMDCFLHCHIMYHRMSGMGGVSRYYDSLQDLEVIDPGGARQNLNADDNRFHLIARIGTECSSGVGREAGLAQISWKISTVWHLRYQNIQGYENEAMIGLCLGRLQRWYPYVGFDCHFQMEGGPRNIFGYKEKNWFGQTSNKNTRKTVMAGIAYTLPLLFIADLRIDGNGKFRFQFGKENIAVTSRLRLNVLVNTDKEYMVGFRYSVSKYFSLSGNYDSDMGMGAGLTLKY